MLSEVRRRADGQEKSDTSQLDAQLATQVYFAEVCGLHQAQKKINVILMYLMASF